MDKYLILSLILSSLLIISLSLASYSYTNYLTLKSEVENLRGELRFLRNISTVSIFIDYGNGSVDTYLVNVVEGLNNTVLEVTRSVALQLDYVYYPSFDDYLIESINNVRSNSSTGFFWLFYINGKLSQVGVKHTLVRDGDTVTWNYTKPQFKVE